MSTINTTALLEQAAEAREAGFTTVATELERKAKLATNLAKAYEFFRYVSREAYDAFQKKILDKTKRPATEADRARLGRYTTEVADQLVIVDMGAYPGLPPADVLLKVKEARAMEIFDRFEVAEIQPVATQVKLPDPIVFGLVDGCTDRFFVAEWGTDVSINDLLQKHEG